MASLATEHEQMAAEWILPEVLLHQGRKSVEATAHVGQSRGQPDLDAGCRRDHSRSAASTRRRAVRLTPSSTRTRLPLLSSISI